MTHDCRHCGETFRTLSKKRLHDCPAEKPDGPEEWDDVDVSNMDQEQIIDRVVQGLMECVHCGEQLDEAYGEIEQKITSEGVSLVAEFDCPECDGHQRNTAELT